MKDANNKPIYSFSWNSCDELKLEDINVPITQVYGICFDDDGKILTIGKKDGDYNLPGGSPEKGEKIIETLKRELLEEASVVIKENPIYLGCNIVRYTSGVDPKTGYKELAQLRFVCKIEDIQMLRPDIDNGELYKRHFVDAKDITKYIKWGELGDEMFKQAIEIASKL
jgi:8-oxo-dGTP pyrophosphatase MutT (NUDIX family)